MFLTCNASDVGAISIIHPNSFIVLYHQMDEKLNPFYTSKVIISSYVSLLVVLFLVPYLLTLPDNLSC